MNPKLSVILPVYNAGEFLREAIKSILDQTFIDFELLIINDASTDTSEKIIFEFKDSRIQYIKNEQNIGLINTLNKGLALAKGIYIARMDNDDVSLPLRFEKQVSFLEANPNFALVASKLILINEKGLETGYWPEDYNTTSEEEIKRTLPIINCIGHPTVMIRADVAKEIKYSLKFKNSEDWGLWLTIISRGYRIAKLDEVLLKYRVHKGSTTVIANKKSVDRKIISFKFKYVTDKLINLNFKKPDRLVLKSFVTESLKYVLKPLLRKPLYTIRLPWLKIIGQFLKVRKQLNGISQQIKLIYIFPFYHTGGADKVHASILEAVNDKTSLTLITRVSENTAFLDKFNEFSNVADVFYLLQSGFTKRWLISKIKHLADKDIPITVMGCNAVFFYEVIPNLPLETKCVDLIHAFVHLNEMGPERWSLPVIERLNTRIVINKKTKTDFEYFYAAQGVNPDYLSRIQYIPNYVEAKELLNKNFEGTLKVLYAGRGSVEKRLGIIAKVAYVLKKKGLPFEFHFAGNVKDFIPEEYLSACVLLGNINDESIMDKIYASSHCLIVASSREGFPMVIMEAMMQGVVPFSTSVGGIPEHIKDEENGVLIKNITEKEITDAFISKFELYANDRKALLNLSESARAYALTNFKKENFFISYIRLLKP